MNNKISWFSPDKLEKDTLWSSVEQASKYAKGELLDIGCGVKPYYKLFSSNIKKYTGLDKLGGDIQGSVLKLPFKNSSFDTLLCTQVLEHVNDPQLAVKEMFRVLKKDGKAIITVPLFWCLHEEPEDYFRFTKYSLSLLLKNAGFKIVYIKERGNWWITTGQIISLCLESSFNKYLLKYPKRIVQFFVQYLFFQLSKIHRLSKNKQAPLGYIIVAEKP